MASAPWPRLLEGGGDDPPAWVVEWCRRMRLQVDQVRWCDLCRCVGYAVDDWERDTLDALGWTAWRHVCPDCAAPIV